MLCCFYFGFSIRVPSVPFLLMFLIRHATLIFCIQAVSISELCSCLLHTLPSRLPSLEHGSTVTDYHGRRAPGPCFWPHPQLLLGMPESQGLTASPAYGSSLPGCQPKGFKVLRGPVYLTFFDHLPLVSCLLHCMVQTLAFLLRSVIHLEFTA